MINKKESGIRLARSVFLHVENRIAEGKGEADWNDLSDLLDCLPQWTWISGGQTRYHLNQLDQIAQLLGESYLTKPVEPKTAIIWDELADELKKLGPSVRLSNENIGNRLMKIKNAQQAAEPEFVRLHKRNVRFARQGKSEIKA